MRVLITGGAGFIGSHLVDQHLAAGDDVVIIDDFSTGRRSNLPTDAVDRLVVREGRVEDATVLDEAFREIDLVYHLAATVGVFEILRRPLESLRSSINACEAIFERCATHGTRVLFTSTSEVYGKNDRGPLKESDDSIYGPTAISRWLYAVSKSADEFMALAYHRERGLPVSVVRLFNTIGPRQTGAYGMVVPRFVAQALAGEPLTVYGDGLQTRCFTNAFDVVRAIRALAAEPRSIGEVVNVGSAREVSIGELARLVLAMVPGSRSSIEFVPYEAAYGAGYEDMRRRVPDVSRLRELVGFVPDTELETSIQQVIDHLSTRRS